jgi:SSS family solute:Na+ symporter
MSRLLAIPIGFVPLAFVFFFPEVLHLSFFTRAIRLSIAVVAVLGFYLPLFSSNQGTTLGLLCAVLATTAWYAMGDPYGIDNIYIALAAPPIVMALDRLFPKAADKRQVAPITNNVE